MCAVLCYAQRVMSNYTTTYHTVLYVICMFYILAFLKPQLAAKLKIKR